MKAITDNITPFAVVLDYRNVGDCQNATGETDEVFVTRRIARYADEYSAYARFMAHMDDATPATVELWHNGQIVGGYRNRK